MKNIYVSSISSKLICNPKGHSSLVLVGMCRSGIWQQTHTNTNFSRKSDPFNMPIGPILSQILNKITRFFKRFLWLKLRKILKNRSIHIQKLLIKLYQEFLQRAIRFRPISNSKIPHRPTLQKLWCYIQHPRCCERSTPSCVNFNTSRC